MQHAKLYCIALELFGTYQPLTYPKFKHLVGTETAVLLSWRFTKSDDAGGRGRGRAAWQIAELLVASVRLHLDLSLHLTAMGRFGATPPV